jgi:hypothetical protein
MDDVVDGFECLNNLFKLVKLCQNNENAMSHACKTVFLMKEIINIIMYLEFTSVMLFLT